MSEVSRLGREQIETAYAMKQLSVAGVRCFNYLEGRELLLESATDKFLLGAVTFAADLEREKARQRTYDALARKAPRTRRAHAARGWNVRAVRASRLRKAVQRDRVATALASPTRTKRHAGPSFSRISPAT